MKRHVRRTTQRAAVAIALGVVTTLAIAWTCVNLPRQFSPGDTGLTQPGRPTWHIRVWRVPGYTTQNFSPVEPEGGYYQHERFAPDLVSYWSRSASPPKLGLLTGQDQSYIWFSESAAGWPLLAVMSDHTNDGRNFSAGMAKDFRGQIQFTTRSGHEWRFPYRPIWPGLVANTALFAAAWAGVLLAPVGVRRWARRRRGACFACGYDLRGAPGPVCPECGHAAGHPDSPLRVD